MPITLSEFTDAELSAKGIDPSLRKSFLEVPSAGELKPSDSEHEYLKSLLAWQEQSARSPIILGVPMTQQYIFRRYVESNR